MNLAGTSATSPAAGGFRGVSPRPPPSETARFHRRRTLFGCASLLLPQKHTLYSRSLRSLSSPLPPLKDVPSSRSLSDPASAAEAHALFALAQQPASTTKAHIIRTRFACAPPPPSTF
jgi:hypothetical protein